MQGEMIIAVYLSDSIPHSVRNSFPIHIFYTTMNGMFANFSLPSSDHKQCNYSHFCVVSSTANTLIILSAAQVRTGELSIFSAGAEIGYAELRNGVKLCCRFAQLVLTKQAIFVGHPPSFPYTLLSQLHRNAVGGV